MYGSVACVIRSLRARGVCMFVSNAPFPHLVLFAQCPSASALLHCLVAYLHTVVGAYMQKFKHLQEEDSDEEKLD
jgi:hypothetical protein